MIDKCEDLINDLRMCPIYTFGDDPDHCDGCTHDMNGCWEKLLTDAADAIEELQKENLRLHAFNDANLEAREMLHERIKELTDTNVGKWIPVTERLPQKCQFYLVTDFGIVEEAYYNSDCVWISRYDDKLKDVTHWMPLSEPPKDGE